VERDAILAAAGIGVAPEVIAFILPEGHLITRYIAGVEWSGDEFKRPEIIVRVAEALRRVHALAPIPGVFDPYRDIKLRLSIARERAIPLPDKIDELLHKLHQIETVRTQALAGHLALCHNDPWANNFLDDGTVRLLDWEFAGMGDPYFDLASAAVVYSKESRAIFLRTYFGQEKPGALEALEQMIFVVMFWNATWALMQIGTPFAEYDYAAMARKMFNFIEALE
jgi:thiamine kinase-like enzyme